jgi:tRNA threonylcarbamoyladenosine biosynthesis protein TsaB
MNLLAIETAASILSAAVSKDEEIFVSETILGTRHSELVMELIDSQMKKSGLLPKDLNGILCMGGPGSFSGLRIGYSIAKGLALSLSIPLASVPTLECIVYNERFKQGITLAVIETRKNAYFNAVFKDGNRLSEDKDSEFSQITDEIARYVKDGQQITLTGYGAKSLYETLPDELKGNITLVDENKGYAKELIAIAESKNLFSNDCTANLYSGPEYIRKTDAEIAKEQEVPTR